MWTRLLLDQVEDEGPIAAFGSESGGARGNPSQILEPLSRNFVTRRRTKARLLEHWF